MRIKVLMMLAVAGCIALAGCANTVAGAGEDISNAGNAISKSAK
ncbi:Entericidin EcnA/B family protein OS=Eoetvoesiella caeni OX=645616 GN=DFR37_103339 PE=3 SV=1 [Eoetvoesiella caeni]|uniref:Entericidin EcnA/B family protein n=1 Tax=Eoetvoesiella caeni TaxID=645616 RepID=A0A366HFT7_9BURK|nr:entericidin A/B family lipoprotein [Eoetvoesiella caeni]RBP40994.1 entericidin EcnA/B family protein [Eoetvoesiella caeni]